MPIPVRVNNRPTHHNCKEIHTPGPTRSLNTPRRYRVCQRWVMIPDVCRSLAARCVVSFSIDVFVRPGTWRQWNQTDGFVRAGANRTPTPNRPFGPPHDHIMFKEPYTSHCSSCTLRHLAFSNRFRLVVSFGYSPAIKRCRAL